MKTTGRALPFLLSLSLIPLPFMADAAARAPSRVEFPNLSNPIDTEKDRIEPSIQTVTQERMTHRELRDFFDTLDRGAAVRLIYQNASEYAGNYSGGDSTKLQIFCRKGVASVEPVPLDKVTEAYVFVASDHLVRIRLTD